MIEIPLTPEAFATRSKEVEQKHGIQLTGNEGTLSKSGVTAKYIYSDGLLKVDIVEKPFFVSTAYCEEQLRKFLGVA